MKKPSNYRRGMRRFAFLLLAIPVLVPAADSPAPRFLSWYDGWGTHTVWGIGKIGGSHSETAVTCGDVKVPVTAIYDTHVDRSKPRESQSAAFARQANRSVLEQFRKSKVSCTFVLTGPDES